MRMIVKLKTEKIWERVTSTIQQATKQRVIDDGSDPLAGKFQGARLKDLVTKMNDGRSLLTAGVEDQDAKPEIPQISTSQCDEDFADKGCVTD